MHMNHQLTNNIRRGLQNQLFGIQLNMEMFLTINAYGFSWMQAGSTFLTKKWTVISIRSCRWYLHFKKLKFISLFTNQLSNFSLYSLWNFHRAPEVVACKALTAVLIALNNAFMTLLKCPLHFGLPRFSLDRKEIVFIEIQQSSNLIR